MKRLKNLHKYTARYKRSCKRLENARDSGDKDGRFCFLFLLFFCDSWGYCLQKHQVLLIMKLRLSHTIFQAVFVNVLKDNFD